MNADLNLVTTLPTLNKHKPMNQTAIDEIVSFWEQGNIPFKDQLIELDINGKPCMCAQGQVLYNIGKVPIERLLNMPQGLADRKTADILGISKIHSILLRIVNDSNIGAPSTVLTNPEHYLGPNYQHVLSFWEYLDNLWGRRPRSYNVNAQHQGILRSYCSNVLKYKDVFSLFGVINVYEVYATLEIICWRYLKEVGIDTLYLNYFVGFDKQFMKDL